MTTDKRFDDSITRWFEETAPARLPERVLDATFERTRTSRQHVGMRGLLARSGVSRAVLALGGAAVIVVAAALALDFNADRLAIVGPSASATLPTTPDAWSRVAIDPGSEGGVDVLAAGPRGLLAAVGEGDDSRLYFSSDGRDWTRVPPDQHQPVGTNGAALVATDRGFLMIGNEVLASDDGLNWRRIADPSDDPDLGAGTPIAAAAGGPGVVAVGSDNRAWYSTDGTDWTLAEVPSPPGEPSQLERPLDRTQTQGVVEMLGVAVAGRNLVAWGASTWIHDDNSATFVPVLWASNDGVSWTNVTAPQSTRYAIVARGPDGFVMEDFEDSGAVWLSADGRSWERVAENAFGSSRWPGLRNDDGMRVQLLLGSIAAGPTGYVAVGTDGVCLLHCSSQEAVIWTSADGRSWSRMPTDDRFSGAGAGPAVAWGSRFIVGGDHDNGPVIWVSDVAPAPGDGAAS